MKEKLAAVTPLVEDLRLQKEERVKQFSDIKAQIEKISGEISGYSDSLNKSLTLQEQDLTLRKLNEYQTHLRTLQKDKVKLTMTNKFSIQVFLQDLLGVLFSCSLIASTKSWDMSTRCTHSAVFWGLTLVKQFVRFIQACIGQTRSSLQTLVITHWRD